VSAPLVFMDTETTGLALDDEIWEFAAIRREPNGTESELHLFIEHDRNSCSKLPASFRDDHFDRYRDHRAVTRREAAQKIFHLFGGYSDEHRPHVVGAVPNFDTERVALLLRRHSAWEPRWHYHLIDVENLAVGWLFGQYQTDQKRGMLRELMPKGPASLALPWDSNEISKAIGVDPDQFERHTAMGDVRWAMAIYDAVTGRAR